MDPDLREELLNANDTGSMISKGNANIYLKGSSWTTKQLSLLSSVSSAAATRPSYTQDSLTRSGGIIPGAIAASVFIVFLLALYTLLWKCMTSPPKRRKSKRRVRLQQKMPV